MSFARARVAGSALLALALWLSPAAFSADPAKGLQLYLTYCRSCHGEDGRGLVANAPDFTRGHGLMAPDARVAQRLRAGSRGMPAFDGILRDNDALDVVAYLRTLQR